MARAEPLLAFLSLGEHFAGLYPPFKRIRKRTARDKLGAKSPNRYPPSSRRTILAPSTMAHIFP
jgi:hypothetical protein